VLIPLPVATAGPARLLFLARDMALGFDDLPTHIQLVLHDVTPPLAPAFDAQEEVTSPVLALQEYLTCVTFGDLRYFAVETLHAEP